MPSKWWSAGLRGVYTDRHVGPPSARRVAHIGELQERPPTSRRRRKPVLVAHTLCGIDIHDPVRLGHSLYGATCKRCAKAKETAWR